MNKAYTKQEKITGPSQSFDDRFNDLMTFKAKFDHFDVSILVIMLLLGDGVVN